MKRGFQRLKIAIAQLNNTIGAFDENLRKLLAFYREAVVSGAELVVFPELCLTGYPPQDLLECRDFIDAGIRTFKQVVDGVDGGAGVIIGHISRNLSSNGKPLFSSVSLIYRGEVIHTNHKRLLPTYDIFDERRYFEPGPDSIPVEFKGLKIGLTICEDIWTDPHICPECRYSINPVEELKARGVDILINVSASPFHLGKFIQRQELARGIIRRIKRPIIYANAVGGQDCLVFDGASFAMDGTGSVFSQLPSFQEAIGVVDLANGTGPTYNLEHHEPVQAINALKLALIDYMRRAAFDKVVVGLSGGIDSSLTAAIACEALGPMNVLGVFMPSRFTSKESMEDARGLARNLGIQTVTIPIIRQFETYLDSLSPLFQDRGWDATEENIQARIRGNILMAISNKFGHLVLSTGNKSELAVGYCTLYGDLSGGFALISDCPKTLVYEMARHLNENGELIPKRVLEKPPSAELRQGQKDEDDLPPYSILDRVIEAYIEEGKTRDEIISMGIEREIVERVMAMIIRSEYKRRQAPLGPRITRKALCCGRRWPVCHDFKG